MLTKRSFPLLLLALLAALSSCSRYAVYPVASKPAMPISGGMVYALPHTRVKVLVDFERRDLSAAPYAEYASSLLGIPHIDSDSVYRIAAIRIAADNVADPQHLYFVRTGGVSLSVGPNQLLSSVGLPAQSLGTPLPAPANSSMPVLQPAAQGEYNLYDRADTFYVRGDKPGHPSLVTSQKDVRSLKQRATAAAEEIREIGDKQQQLLFGEYDGDYSTETLRFLYQKLDERKLAIQQQFTGTIQRETVTFFVDPKDEKALIDAQSVPLFSFSPVDGLTTLGDDTSQWVTCSIVCVNSLRQAARFVKFRTSGAGKGSATANSKRIRKSFRYRIPETACVTVSGAGFEVEQSVKIAQFGPIVELPRRKFKAIFDSQSGELIYYQGR